MPAAEARVQTRDASRYLIRLCQHAGKMQSRFGHGPLRHSRGGAPPEVRHAEWSDTGGILVLSLGQCILHADGDTLTLRAEASSAESLTQMQELIAKRLGGFGMMSAWSMVWLPISLPA